MVQNGVEGGIYTWKRYRIWIDAIMRFRDWTSTRLITLVDDGSAELPDWPDTTILREADGLTSTAKIVLYHFEARLGRLSVTNFPGWIRSFFFPAVWAAANGFNRVIHVESDAHFSFPPECRIIATTLTMAGSPHGARDTNGRKVPSR